MSFNLISCDYSGNGFGLNNNDGGYGNNHNPFANSTSKTSESNQSIINSSENYSVNDDSNSEIENIDDSIFEFDLNINNKEACVRFKSGTYIQSATIPKYLNYNNEKYSVVNDDYMPGFSYNMSVETIILPEGFKEISNGFAQDINLKKVVMPSTIEKISESILVGCTNFEKIEYNGTKAMWQSINKNSNWNYLAKDFIISCKDGNINVPKWQNNN